MPSVSQRQHNYFEGVAHGDIAAPASTQRAAREYVRADVGRPLKALPVRAKRPLKARVKRRSPPR